jgi:hypothetical protein
MSMKKSSVTSADKHYLEFVERTAKEVANWPSWMRGSTVEDAKESPSKRRPSPQESGEVAKSEKKR